MKTIKQRFEDNYLLGCIKSNGESNFYLMPLAWWILNYQKYDPGYNPSDWEYIYRDNILNVSDDNVENFFKSIKDDKVDVSSLKSVKDRIPKEFFRIDFYIDFDKKIFVNGINDNVEIEEYLPDDSWKGFVDDPIIYLPDELKIS